MNAQKSSPAPNGFSLLELLVTVAIIGILAALLAPSLSKSFGKAKQIHCVSKLRQVGLGLHSFAQDHNGSFPWQIPTLKGGSMYETRFQLRASPLLSYSGRHFEVLSNELVTPKILVCPADKRESAETFTKLKTNNLSYWVFYRATLNDPTHPLAGDLNVQSVGTNRSRLGGRTNLLSVRFDQTVHQFKGNILFSDGHVEGIKNADLPDVAPSGPTTGFNSVQSSPGNESVGSLGTTEITPPSTPSSPHSNPVSTPSGDSKVTSIPSTSPKVAENGSARVEAVFPTESNGATNNLKLPQQQNGTDFQVGLMAGGANSKPPPSLTPGLTPPSSSSPPGPGGFPASGGVKSTPEPDDLDSFWPPNLRALQDGIKFSFILGIILTLLGFLWYFLNRRRKEKSVEKRQTSPSYPEEL